MNRKLGLGEELELRPEHSDVGLLHGVLSIMPNGHSQVRNMLEVEVTPQVKKSHSQPHVTGQGESLCTYKYSQIQKKKKGNTSSLKHFGQ